MCPANIIDFDTSYGMTTYLQFYHSSSNPVHVNGDTPPTATTSLLEGETNAAEGCSVDHSLISSGGAHVIVGFENGLVTVVDLRHTRRYILYFQTCMYICMYVGAVHVCVCVYLSV
jgi:hypothetical protein